MKIRKQYCWLPLLYIGWGLIFPPLEAQNARWVNPFIGTGKCDAVTIWGNYGGTYPGAVAPWGMVQLTPETSIRPSETGYYYEDLSIRSFSCLNHRSGYPDGSAGKLHLLFMPANISNVPTDYTGRTYSHETEKAEPGYYSVSFIEGDRVEMTATTHAGIFRYHSDAPQTTVVIFQGGELTIENERIVKASLLHTQILFAEPFHSYELRGDTAYLHFSKPATVNGLMIQIASSAHSFEAAERNRQMELAGKSFEQVRQSTYAAWDKELACVEVESGQPDDKEMFYTALYHAFLQPSMLSDAGDQELYTGFSPWDTFRTLHPLLSLLKPERQQDMIRSMMEEYRITGLLPKGPMTGFHAIPILFDAYLKGTTNEDPEEMYAAAKAFHERHVDTPFWEDYAKNGFVNASLEKSVSITSEYAYNDWILAQFAHLLGKEEEAKQYEARSYNYRNLFDVETLFLLPRDGTNFLRTAGELGFQESNKWTASYFAPHNVQDLINLSGGKQEFVERLQYGFDTDKILFDNEPVFHYPYLFTWAGRPDLTVRYTAKIMRDMYRNTPGGIPGNDDLGSMSSWWAFAAMGIMPACPGSGEYLLSEPIFDKVTIRLANGNCIEIVKEGKPKADRLPSVRLAGNVIPRWLVSHQELIENKQLTFDWNHPVSDYTAFQLPYSETKQQPTFNVAVASPKQSVMFSGTINRLPFTVRNVGVKGSYIANLTDGDRTIATKRILVDTVTAVQDTLNFTLYKEGRYHLHLAEKVIEIHVKDSAVRSMPFECTELSVPSLAAIRDTFPVVVTLCNIAGKEYAQEVPIYLNNQIVTRLRLSLESGEVRQVSVPLCCDRSGFHTLQVLNARKRTKVYSDALETCILDLDYNHRDSAKVFDRSGFGNDGLCYGPLRWGKDYVETTDHAYIAFPRSESLMTTGKTLSLVTWVAPQQPIRSGTYADFFTKGDYTLMKMEGPESLAFFAGGWGRGMCQIPIPSDWYTGWHMIAGVCTGGSLKLYLDGKLMQEIQVAGELTDTEVPWNLGRNAEMPFSRFSDMRFGKTRIYGTALSDEHIRKLYEQEYPIFKSK